MKAADINILEACIFSNMVLKYISSASCNLSWLRAFFQIASLAAFINLLNAQSKI